MYAFSPVRTISNETVNMYCELLYEYRSNRLSPKYKSLAPSEFTNRLTMKEVNSAPVLMQSPMNAIQKRIFIIFSTVDFVVVICLKFKFNFANIKKNILKNNKFIPFINKII